LEEGDPVNMKSVLPILVMHVDAAARAAVRV
jgi:hypothetical protein